MNALEAIVTRPGLEALGWALIHFLWQGALVATLLGGVMRILQKRSANVRYLLACAALLLMAALPAYTVWQMSLSSPASMDNGTLQTATSTSLISAVEQTDMIRKQNDVLSDHSSFQSWQYSLYERLDSSLPWLLALWFVGVLFMSLRLLGGAIYTHRFRRSRTQAVDKRWQETVNRLAERLRVMRPVQVLESSLVLVPMAIGWLRPVIMLPASALTGLTPRQLEAILAHELAHIRRYDYLVNLFQSIIETLLFYHPAVWWVSRRIRLERENCCDDLAVEVCGDALCYARALARVERIRKAAPRLAVAADGGLLMKRIERIVNVRAPRSNFLPGMLASVIAILIMIAIMAGTQISLVSNSVAVGDTRATSESLKSQEAESSDNESIAITANDSVGEASDRTGDSNDTELAAAIEGELSSSVSSPLEEQDDLPVGAVEGIRALSSSNPEERAAAACSLGRLGAVSAIPSLIKMLGDDTPLKTTLRCWGGGWWSPAIETFKQPSPGEHAAIALAAMSQEAVAPLIAALNNENPSVRRNAAWAIGEVRGGRGTDRSDAVEPLMIALMDDDWWVRKAAARALGEVHDHRAAESLIAALGDVNSGVRQTAAWALGDMKSRRGVEGLISTLLSDQDWKVRRQSAWALGEIKASRAVEALNNALNDENERVRSQARWALSEILD